MLIIGSGDGKFLDSSNDNQLTYINYNNTYRCNDEQFLLDKAPHDITYFELQYEKINYFNLSAFSAPIILSRCK